jgi:hypothetical protein
VPLTTLASLRAASSRQLQQDAKKDNIKKAVRELEVAALSDPQAAEKLFRLIHDLRGLRAMEVKRDDAAHQLALGHASMGSNIADDALSGVIAVGAHEPYFRAAPHGVNISRRKKRIRAPTEGSGGTSSAKK